MMHEQRPGRKSKLPWLILGGAMVFIVAMLVRVPMAKEAKAAKWSAFWSEQFRRCHTLAEVQALARPELIYTRTFPDGSWVAAKNEWDCTDGAGFDAAIFYDSTSRLQVDRLHHFCGFEGLEGELRGISATSLRDFYAALQQCQLKELK
jgi:hypothetical protein